MITDYDVKSFQELYKKNFRRDITQDDARSKLLLLVKQAEILFANGSENNDEYGDENEQNRPGLYS